MEWKLTATSNCTYRYDRNGGKGICSLDLLSSKDLVSFVVRCHHLRIPYQLPWFSGHGCLYQYGVVFFQDEGSWLNKTESWPPYFEKSLPWSHFRKALPDRVSNNDYGSRYHRGKLQRKHLYTQRIDSLRFERSPAARLIHFSGL